MAGLLAGALLFTGGLVSGAALKSPKVRNLNVRVARDPNILLIVTDDQRVGTLDVMPATRRYFRDGGVSFSNAFTSTPLCCPSRASIMSGRYPHNHKVERNAFNGLLDQDSVLQRYLRRDGYKTAIVGKYFNGWEETEDPPPHFDRWAIIDDLDYEYVYENFLANVDGTIVHPDGYSTEFISNTTEGILRDFEDHDDQPWFLYVAPFSPHEPFVPEKKYEGAPTRVWDGSPAVFEEDRSDKPPWVQGRAFPFEAGRSIATAQRRTLMSADDLVADLVEAMAELDEERDTLAIFVSDNGYLWGEHGLSSKRVPYTGSIAVPLMVRWPGTLPEGIRDERLVMNIDIAPTILKAADISPDPAFPIDGIPLLGAKPRSAMLIEYFGAFEFGGVPQWASLRSKAFQYVEYYSPTTGEIIFREYYDLSADPFQLVNLLADSDISNDPAISELSNELAEARACSGGGCVLGLDDAHDRRRR